MFALETNWLVIKSPINETKYFGKTLYFEWRICSHVNEDQYWFGLRLVIFPLKLVIGAPITNVSIRKTFCRHLRSSYISDLARTLVQIKIIYRDFLKQTFLLLKPEPVKILPKYIVFQYPTKIESRQIYN